MYHMLVNAPDEPNISRQTYHTETCRTLAAHTSYTVCVADWENLSTISRDEFWNPAK